MVLSKRDSMAAAALLALFVLIPATAAQASDCSGIPAWSSTTTYALGQKVTRTFVSGSGNPGVVNNAGTVGSTYAYKNLNGGRWGDDPAVASSWSVWGALLADGSTTAGSGQSASACGSGGPTPTNTPTPTHTSTPTATATTGGGCSAFHYCTAYAVGSVVTYNGSNYTAVGAISSTRDCSAYAPPTDNWWNLGGTCGGGGATPTNTATPTPTATSAGGGGNIGAIVSSSQFDLLWPPVSRNPLYTYADFTSVMNNYFPALCGIGTANDKKRECAAFFANSDQEVGQGRLVRECYCQPAGVPECDYYNGAGVAGPGYTSPACDYNNAPWGNQTCGGGAAGVRYFGRGPLQLSWNANYCDAQAGTGGGTALFNNPDAALFGTDHTRLWQVAGWYWMTSTGSPVTNSLGVWPQDTMHTAMTASGCVAGTGLCGFADTIRAINGALECPNGGTPQQNNRVTYYNGSGAENDEDGSGGTLGVLGYTGGVFGRRHCSQ